MTHALLSPSGASKWIACPPSARLEETFPDSSSSYADEGTLAHSLAELLIKYKTGKLSKNQYEKQFTAIKKSEYYSNEMLEYMQDFAVFVVEKLNEAVATSKHPPLLLQETTVDLSGWAPESFGTTDNLIAASHKLCVIDLKYGKGVEVSAEYNKQMMLYGLGGLDILEMFYPTEEITEIEFIIYQPRMNNISVWSMPIDELRKWGEIILKPAAKHAFKGTGEFSTGKHCKFCKAKPVCRAYADEQMEIAQYEFRKEPLLTKNEVSDILDVMDGVISWLNAVYEHALDQAVNKSAVYPRYKLVEGRSNRLISDPDKAVLKLYGEGFTDDEIRSNKLLSMTELEKLVGPKNFAAVMGDLIIKPSGKPTLVPDSDKRPAIDSTEDAIKDFS